MIHRERGRGGLWRITMQEGPLNVVGIVRRHGSQRAPDGRLRPRYCYTLWDLNQTGSGAFALRCGYLSEAEAVQAAYRFLRSVKQRLRQGGSKRIGRPAKKKTKKQETT